MMVKMAWHFYQFIVTNALVLGLWSAVQGQVEERLEIQEILRDGPERIENNLDCPKGWLSGRQSCYLFILQPQRTVQQAELECKRQQAELITVDSDAEHAFVNNWLMAHDVGQRQNWITSGRRIGRKFVWTSDGSEIQKLYFPDIETKNEERVDKQTGTDYNLIVYSYNATKNSYEWDWGRIMDPMCFVCEIEKQDLWKVYQHQRDFTFGNDNTDSLDWPVAPKITEISEDVVFFMRGRGEITPVEINCVATGNPQPTYRWYRKTSGGGSVLLSGNSHYTIINGRLNIQKPDIDKDVGTYYCEANNQHGTVLSDDIHLTYGKLDEFSNVRQGVYISKLYMGIEIDCQPPNYKPDARFNWYKGSVLKFIRPDLNPQMFLSLNGKLYITEVAVSDAGDYFCAVHLAPRQGERLASGQTVSRNSMAITLKVEGDNANTYGPDIQDRFPQVFPKIPLVGQRMVLECLAYGRLPLVYTWVREDGPMNPKAYLRDRNRRLIIDEARLQDSGAYTCVVEGLKSAMNRTRYIRLSGAPISPLPLKNQFLDAGSSFTWSCLAQGIPVPTYSWYKDGKQLGASNNDMNIMIRGRHLTFKSVSDKNNGVYECVATNVLGSSRSSAQVRAVSFAPSFKRNPVKAVTFGGSGGRITIDCLPEGAPRPVITWRMQGAGALPANSRILPTGSLQFNDLGHVNTGTYVCEASNSLGSSESATQLTVTDETVLVEAPDDDKVNVNGTTTLRCKVSYDESKSDVVYSWKFYDHVIDLDKEVAYSMPYLDSGTGTLYLLSAQYEHEGRYTCVASTVTGSVEKSAYLTVEGAPEPPIGVHRCNTCNQGLVTIELHWMPGRRHTYPITHYYIEVKSELDEGDNWIVILDGISEEDSKLDSENMEDWRRAVVSEGLSPGSSYTFRVTAGNRLVGYGPPSKPSPSYRIPDAGPVFAPTGVRGGGGKERELHIEWDPLPRGKWGSDHIRYIVYFRMKDGDTRLNSKWQSTKELLRTEYNTVVSDIYYYTAYEVMVSAVNAYGAGPNSSIAIVRSAEKMPTLTPEFSQANAINGTAGTVEWERVPNTREAVKGAIFGFQVNYWLEDTRCIGKFEKTARFTRVYGDVTSADVIGLKPGGDYCVNIQLLNNAGMGPKTENFYLGMNDAAPTRYPEYVHVMSHGPESVMVAWRGLVNQFGESPLVGYKAWYWKLQENIRSAKKVDFGRTFRGVIRGIERNEIYRMRMMGYNDGGEGKKAPDILFTLGGMVNFNPLTTEVMNKGQGDVNNRSLIGMCVVVCLTWIFVY